jgi:hypothetical protein
MSRAEADNPIGTPVSHFFCIDLDSRKEDENQILKALMMLDGAAQSQPHSYIAQFLPPLVLALSQCQPRHVASLACVLAQQRSDSNSPIFSANVSITRGR